MIFVSKKRAAKKVRRAKRTAKKRSAKKRNPGGAVRARVFNPFGGRKRKKSMARKRRRARRRKHRRTARAAPVTRRRRRRSNPRRRHRSAMRSHTTRHFAVNPRRRRHRRRGRRRNPGFSLGKGGMSWKKALPIVVVGGAVTAGALYAGGQAIMRYPGKTPTSTAAIAGGIAIGAGVLAAVFAGPIAGTLVAATLGTVAISALQIAKLPPGTGMTTGDNTQGMAGYRALTSRNIPQLGMILSDNMTGYRPMGTILSDNMRGMGSLGAGPRVRGRYGRDTETSRIISDLAHS